VTELAACPISSSWSMVYNQIILLVTWPSFTAPMPGFSAKRSKTDTIYRTFPAAFFAQIFLGPGTPTASMPPNCRDTWGETDE